MHTEGGNVVTISGRNFGTFSRAAATYGLGTKLRILPDFTSTSMQVEIPAGDGLALPLAVRVAQQEDVVYGSLADAVNAGEDPLDPALVLGFKYYAPNVSAVAVPSGGLSTLGGYVTLTGSDLGKPGSLSAVLLRAVDYDTDSSSIGGGSGGGRRELLSFMTNSWGDLEVVTNKEANKAATQAKVVVAADAGSTSVGFELGKEEASDNQATRRRRRLGGSSQDDDAYVASDWYELDFSVQVLNSTHDFALISIGPGEGINELLINVSGQVSLTPLAYAAPILTSVDPGSSPTQGGVNVTVTGQNLGVGDLFELRLSGEGTHCNHVWTQDDLEVSVFEYSHDKFWFLTMEGQCDTAMELTLEVAGQLSNALLFSFDPPTIEMLSLDGMTPLGSDCARSSSRGCGLDTTGGYTVTVTGTNFGLADQTVTLSLLLLYLLAAA